MMNEQEIKQQDTYISPPSERLQVALAIVKVTVILGTRKARQCSRNFKSEFRVYLYSVINPCMLWGNPPYPTWLTQPS